MEMSNITLQSSTYEPSPLITIYNNRFRSLVDAIYKINHLQIMKEGIQFPTIVAVGNQSSGKSSIVESLTGINLPCGEDICTRLPLIIRFEHHTSKKSEFFLEFEGKSVCIDETHIAKSISNATEEIAGKGKGIVNIPLTLVVKKKGVPDFIVVDLPGINTIAAHNKTDDIDEKISQIIMEYISPQNNIILNVLSSTIDFCTCESTKMSQSVDKSGKRTLYVVTKIDKAPEDICERVNTDCVDIGMGFVCVRNRIGDESIKHARIEEVKLFESHPLLCRIDKSIMGVTVLAQKLVEIQVTCIKRRFPEIAKTLEEKLKLKFVELNKLPHDLSSDADVINVIVQIIGSVTESVKKICLRGEFDEYPNDRNMHCIARIEDMLNEFCRDIYLKSDMRCKDKFLVEEIQLLEETKVFWLPNFLIRRVFITILQRKVEAIACSPVEFIQKVWNYIEKVVLRVITSNSKSYPELQNYTRIAVQNMILRMKEISVDRVREIVEMEKLADYTCDPEYMNTWNVLIAHKNNFIDAVNDKSKSDMFNISDYGEVQIGHLREKQTVVEQAFDINMRLAAYWKIVLKRLVDNLALHIIFNIQNFINKELNRVISKELVGQNNRGIKRILEESPCVATKKSKLKKSINFLKESQEVVFKIMDGSVRHDIDII